MVGSAVTAVKVGVGLGAGVAEAVGVGLELGVPARPVPGLRAPRKRTAP